MVSSLFYSPSLVGFGANGTDENAAGGSDWRDK